MCIYIYIDIFIIYTRTYMHDVYSGAAQRPACGRLVRGALPLRVQLEYKPEC